VGLIRDEISATEISIIIRQLKQLKYSIKLELILVSQIDSSKNTNFRARGSEYEMVKCTRRFMKHAKIVRSTY